MTIALALIAATLAWIAGAIEPAHAGPVVPIIVGLVGLTGTAAAVVSGVISIGIGIGVSYLASKLFKPKAPDEPAPGKQTVAGLELDLRIDADVPQSLIVGTAVTAGSLVYAETYGYIPATDTVEEIRNSNLIEIISLADHPVQGLVAVFVEGQARAISDTGTDRGYTVNDYGDKLAVRFFDGTQIQADTYTVSALGLHQSRPWSWDCVGTGIAYARQHSIYDQDKVPGRLTWKYVVNGIKLYDPRKDSTVGGSGSHRFDDLSTHEFTSNLPVIIYNVLRGIRVKNADGVPVHFYGLENTPAANLPLDNWFAAMNEADVAIDGELQFHGGGETAVNVEPHAFVQELLKGCDGRLTEVGGVYKLHVGAPELPVISITDEALRADESDPFKPILPLTQRINYVTGKFTSPADGWVSRVAPPRSQPDWEAADGRRLPADLDAPIVQSDAHMQRLMQQMMRKARQQRRHVIPLGPGAFGVEPGDTIEWNSTRNGYVGKIFRVDGVDVHPNLNVTLAVTEEDPADYDWDSETDLVPTTALPLAISRPAPKVLEDFNADPYTIVADNGIRRPAILLTWTPPEDGDINGVGVRIRRPAYPADISSLLTDEPESGQVIIATSLAPNTEYEVSARFRSFNGWPTEWSLWIPVTTPDVGFSIEEIEKGARDYFKALEARLRTIESNIRGVAAIAAGADSDTLLIRAAERVTLQKRTDEFRTGIAGNTAAITTVQEISADNEAAIASLTTTVEANGASIEINATAISTISGHLSASFGVTLNVDGYASGFYNYNTGEGSSAFLIQADLFAVGTPTLDGSEAVYPFIISTVGGVAAVGLNGALVVDGSVTTPSLAVGAVTSVKIASQAITSDKIDVGAINASNMLADNVVITGKLRANAATYLNAVNGSSGSIGGNTSIDVASLVMPVEVGPVTIQGSAYFNGETSPHVNLFLQVLIDGSLYESFPVPLTSTGDNYQFNAHVVLPLVANLSVGNRAIVLRITSVATDVGSVSFDRARLIIMESRR